MASEEIEHESVRAENTLETEDHPQISDDMSSQSSTDTHEAARDLERIATSRSVRERRFEPINVGDREALSRIASTFGSASIRSSKEQNLERIDTLAGITLGDSVLDPSSPDFDVYKWSRM